MVKKRNRNVKIRLKNKTMKVLENSTKRTLQSGKHYYHE